MYIYAFATTKRNYNLGISDDLTKSIIEVAATTKRNYNIDWRRLVYDDVLEVMATTKRNYNRIHTLNKLVRSCHDSGHHSPHTSTNDHDLQDRGEGEALPNEHRRRSTHLSRHSHHSTLSSVD